MDKDKDELLRHITYSLSSYDILSALKNSGVHMINRKKTIVQTVIVSVAMFLFAFSFAIYGTKQNFIMTIVCALVIASMWIVPALIERKQGLKNKGKDIKIELKLHKDKLEVNKQDEILQIDKNSKTTVKEYSDMFIFYIENRKILPIPFKHIKNDELEDIKKFIDFITDV